MAVGGSLTEEGACPPPGSPGEPRSEAEAALRLHLAPGLGDRRAARLLRELGTPRGVVARPSRVREVAGAEVARSLGSEAIQTRAALLLLRARELGVRVVPWGAAEYPHALLDLPDPPPLLFLAGDPALLSGRGVAVVGSRRASPVGRRAAERIGRDLSRNGVRVWSGLALGVDGAAHRGALDGRGGTVAVLGAGLDRPYPRAHASLLRRIARAGLVVTEFPPGTRPRPHHFPRRNRILAALTEAVLVVEAAPGSGALITVDHAQDLGRGVLAVPGSVESAQSRGTNALLRDGAGVVENARDVLDHLRWGVPAPDPGFLGPPGEGLTPAEARIIALLGAAPASLEEILDRTGFPPSRVLATLTGLEIGDRVRRVPEGWILGPGTP